jgi:hypothetical protein
VDQLQAVGQVLGPIGADGPAVRGGARRSLDQAEQTDAPAIGEGYDPGGDNDIEVGDQITLTAWLFGDDTGSSKSRLKGGGGNNVLVGGSGNDMLIGGPTAACWSAAAGPIGSSPAPATAS